MSFYTEVIQKDPRFNSPQRISDEALLEPYTRSCIAALIADAAAQGARFVVIETYRSVARQEQMFADHLSQLSTAGCHHFGVAADLVRITGGADWNAADYTILGELAPKHGLVWGGAWGDNDHVQSVTLAQQPSLFAGTWYPWYPGETAA